MRSIEQIAAEAKAKNVIQWSPQQNDFLEWAKNGVGSCVLIAVAGAGKTSVLLAAGEAMKGGVAYVAYNKDIVEETKSKLAERGIDWKKNGSGYRAQLWLQGSAQATRQRQGR